MHRAVEPAILYFGTPVVLISTRNEDQTINVAPNSSIWWLGWSAMLGLDGTSKTTENLQRTGECVLNLASDGMASSVNRIAMLTGSDPIPLHKRFLGYQHCKDKLSQAGLSALASDTVSAPRIGECLVQLEARVKHRHAFGRGGIDDVGVPCTAFELAITRIHVDESLLAADKPHHVDPDKWHPLIMSFRQFYTTHGRVGPSRLAQGSESLYAPWRAPAPVRGFSRALFKWFNRRHRLE